MGLYEDIVNRVYDDYGLCIFLRDELANATPYKKYYPRYDKPIRNWSHAAKMNLSLGIGYVKIEKPKVEWVYE